MRRKLAPALLGLALLAGPLFAVGLTTDELIQNLLQQIRQLQEQLRILQGGSNVPQSCVVLNYNLYLGLTDGDTNGEVTKLQQFLASDRSIYPEGRVTGYFGPATERAVRRYQSRNGIVSSGSPETTGYGVVGPKTREYMARGCTSTQQFSLSVIGVPMNPLQVNQVGTWTLQAVPNNWALTYSASWGDGRSTVGQTSPLFSHAYTYAGTFTPSFTALSGTGRTASANAPTVTVVGTTNQVTFTASPTSGVVPLSVQFSGRGLREIGAYVLYSLDFGDGAQVTLNNLTCTQMGGGGNTCEFSYSHTYTASGTYTAKLKNIRQECLVAPCDDVVGTATIIVAAQSTGISFSASPTSGTAPLTVGFTGVATRPNFAADGQSSINFGDGTSRNITNFADPPAGTSIPALGPFAETHTYTTAGTFTATMTSAGGGTRTATITVSSAPEYGTLSVTPTSGTAPLSVTATFTVGSPCSAYTLIWGDGTNDSYTPASGSSCSQVVTTLTKTHSYGAGTYTITFQASGSTSRTVGVTVSSGASACTPTHTTSPNGWMTLWATPQSGAAPLSVQFDVTPGLSTFSPDRIDFGDGSATVPVTSCISHTYASAGTYTARLSKGDSMSWNGSSATVTVTAPSNGPLTVSPQSGPAPLSVTAILGLVGAGGSAPPWSCFPYTLEWGDGAVVNVPSQTCSPPMTATHAHTYASAGTYTVRYYIPNSNYSHTAIVTVTAQ